MKKFRKKIVVFALIILIGFVVSRIYCFVIVNRVYRAINEFREAENRFYEVVAIKDEQFDYEEKILKKEAEIKYLKKSSNLEVLYFEYRNFDTNKKYLWINREDGNKILKQNELYIRNRNFIVDVPTLMSEIYSNSKFNLEEFLNLYYIVFVKYEGKKCYKMVTKYETVIINKETYLPEYSCKKFVNSVGKSVCKIEYFYKVEMDTITEENLNKL